MLLRYRGSEGMLAWAFHRISGVAIWAFILLHILDISWMPERDPIREYQAINRELALFNAELAEKRQIIVINKVDLPVVRENLPQVLPWFAERSLKVFPISAATGEGIPPLLDEIARNLWGKADEEY